MLPEALLDRFARAVVRRLDRTHPKLLDNLARLAPATVHIVPADLPYRFAMELGAAHFALKIVPLDAGGADAEVRASVATLIELLEGRIDGDTLFFRRDLTISGDTAAIVGLRNVLDREEIRVADELSSLFGPLQRPARVVGRALDGALDRFGARVAAMHRTLHPQSETGQDVGSELDRCRTEITALTARLAKLEARQKRRDEKAA